MTRENYGEMSELAEGARLEIVCAVKSGTEGSNPSLSAMKNSILVAFLLLPVLVKYSYIFLGNSHVLLGFRQEIPPADI